MKARPRRSCSGSRSFCASMLWPTSAIRAFLDRRRHLHRGEELEEQLAPPLRRIEKRAVAGPLEHLHLDPPAGGAIPLEDAANLRDHGLGWKDLFPRPPGYKSHLAEGSHLPGGAVRYDDVRGAVRPQDRSLGIEVDDHGPGSVLAGDCVHDTTCPWR